MRNLQPFSAVAIALLMACQPPTSESGPVTRESARAPASATPGPLPATVEPQSSSQPATPLPIASALTRTQWAKAENRAVCAPLVLTDDGGAPAKARPVRFAGGWAVAFDLPDLRSAYGVAGAGLTRLDDAAPREQRERLAGQWPLFRELEVLPPPAFAGFGLEGAQPYPDADPDSRGRQSLAYVRVGEQRCTYNVWSKLGRAHLEVLLQSLRPLDA